MLKQLLNECIIDLTISPDGSVLPCQTAREIPGLQIPTVEDGSLEGFRAEVDGGRRSIQGFEHDWHIGPTNAPSQKKKPEGPGPGPRWVQPAWPSVRNWSGSCAAMPVRARWKAPAMRFSITLALVPASAMSLVFMTTSYIPAEMQELSF